MKRYLQPTQFLDFENSSVCEFAERHGGAGSAREKAVRLNLAVRDGIRYDPYGFRLDPARYKASYCLESGSGFCVPKAILLAAAARAVGIPARLGYADVRNHLTSPRLAELMQSDVFRWHGYVLLHVDGRWLKATPAFDAGLCARFGVRPLEFDGTGDSVFHEFDVAGRRHMEYLRQLGEFDDFPYDLFEADMRTHYAHLIAAFDDNDRLRRQSHDASFAPATGQSST